MNGYSGEQACEISICGQTLSLLPERVIWWERQNTIIISDTHFGKPAHFRKFGIPIPGTLNDKDITRLRNVITGTEAKRVIITGDLFHSEINREWTAFTDLLAELRGVSFILVPGNHDILPDSIYQDAGLQITQQSLDDGPFTFIHSTEDAALDPDHRFFIGGHIHPMYRINGKARQSIRIPCFHLTENSLTLPSFGSFTGGHTIIPGHAEKVYGVTENRVLDLSSINAV